MLWTNLSLHYPRILSHKEQLFWSIGFWGSYWKLKMYYCLQSFFQIRKNIMFLINLKTYFCLHHIKATTLIIHLSIDLNWFLLLLPRLKIFVLLIPWVKFNQHEFKRKTANIFVYILRFEWLSAKSFILIKFHLSAI